MRTIVGIRLRKPGKIYFFDPDGKELKKGDHVIIETSLGKEYEEIKIPNKEETEEKIVNQ